uniref:Keratin-associated protein n=1 Tax=Sus scrofa TaxID=9823 RepID=A0A8W4FPM7_PIG
MSYNCCSANFSSHSLGDLLHYSGSSCGSVYPNNLVYSTNLCSPSTCQGGFSVCSDCQETCSEPIRCQAFCVVSSPCYHLRTSTFFSPCQRTFSGSLGFGPSNFGSFGCGSPSLGFRSSAFSSLSCRSNFYHPTYFSSRSCQSASFQPACGSGFY